MFSLATTPHETVWNSFSCKGARHRGRKQSSKRAYVRSAAKADEDEIGDVDAEFERLGGTVENDAEDD